MMASRSLGAMFHVGAGTAATQNWRRAAEAAGAADNAAAPVPTVTATIVARRLTEP
jgi:hypothetical protein